LNINPNEILAKPEETLEHHTNEVVKVCKIILSRLNKVTKKFAEVIGEDFFLSDSDKSKELQHYIVEICQYHDYGKVNPYFQRYIKGDWSVPAENKEHSIYSFYLWLIYFVNSNQSVSKETLIKRVLIAYGAIAGHHGRLKVLKSRFATREGILTNQKYIKKLYEWGILDQNDVKTLMTKMKVLQNELTKNEMYTEGYLLTFSKFVYSILVNSDSIASSSISSREYETMVDQLFFRNINEVNFDDAYNRMSVIDSVNRSLISAEQEFIEMKVMNDLRTLVNKKAKASYEEGIDIYILESPVGSGKTLSSLILVIEILYNEGKRKLINTFPLNSVQSQYVKTIVEEIGVSEEYVNVVNSESLFGVENELQEGKEEALRVEESNLWLFNRNCFANEIIITSHVRFFDTFTCVKRKGALGFLSLIDAVVVIDEFQNYRKEYWYQIWGELLKISKILGTKFIFTTGTLPVSEKQILSNYGDKVKKVFTSKENKQLFASSLIKDRCKIEMLGEGEYSSIEFLKEEIVKDFRIREKQGWRQFIICMSFVEHTKRLYSLLKEEISGYYIYYLCGRHSPGYKKALIKKIKEHNDSMEDKVILVTTKTVECGMDFDFDYGYKEFDRFDAVEQLSGRINRSNKKVGCGAKVFIWKRNKLEDEKLFDFSEDVLDKLNNKEFVQLYEDVYENNKIDIKRVEDHLSMLHLRCSYSEYSDIMKIIDDDSFTTNIYWVLPNEEERFIETYSNLPASITFAEKVQNSIRVKKKLERFEMTVTNFWLSDMVKLEYLKELHINGVNYYLVKNEKAFLAYCVDKYEIDNVVSYIESKIYKEI